MIQAENLLKIGLHPSEILIGFEKGGNKCLELIEELACYRVNNVKDSEELPKCIKSAIASKQFGLETFLGSLIA